MVAVPPQLHAKRPPRSSRAEGETCSGQRSSSRSRALLVRSRSCWRGDPLPIASCHGEAAARPGRLPYSERPPRPPDPERGGAGQSQGNGQEVPPPARFHLRTRTLVEDCNVALKLLNRRGFRVLGHLPSRRVATSRIGMPTGAPATLRYPLTLPNRIRFGSMPTAL